jgi:sugar transferase (PEP-CTERM/EpsH1 system associated)
MFLDSLHKAQPMRFAAPVVTSQSPLAPGSRRPSRSGMNVLRVLHVVNRLDTGGMEYGVLKVIEGLDWELFEHRLCATRGFNPEIVRLRHLENQVCTVGRPNAGAQFLVFRLARIMKEYRPHIVHSRNWGAIEAVIAGRLARVPVVVHSEHGYELEILSGFPFRRRVLCRTAYAMADAVFTVSRELSEYHARQVGLAPGRIRVIPNGVDTLRFADRPQQRASLRQQFGLPADSFVIGTVGRMVPIKDHATLLRAAETLVARRIEVSILLVGTGPELSGLRQSVENSSALRERVRFLGVSDQVPDVLNALDVFVLPSISEGMSNTLLEAMASGLPVVATRVGGNPELIEENRSGWLFAPRDVGDLTERLARLSRDPALRRQLGAAARQRALDYFSLDRMLEDYRKLYLDLAERRGASARVKS